MTKVYHSSDTLLFIDKPATGAHRQDAICRAINDSIKRIYDAKEIWFYDCETETFESYKITAEHNTKCLLIEFLGSHDISVCASGENSTTPNSTMRYCFATVKDQFLFKLKF